MRVQKRSKSVHPKKRSLEKTPPLSDEKSPPLSDEKSRKTRPLQILVDEADKEMSDATDSDFGDVLPPTPQPPPSPPVNPSPPVDDQEATMQTDTDEDYDEQEDDDEDDDDESDDYF